MHSAYSAVISTHTSGHTTINKCLASGKLVQLLASDDSAICGLLACCQDQVGTHTNVVHRHHLDLGVEIQGQEVQKRM